MTIKEMHYDIKYKLNKIDSQQYKNLLVPEIDWVLNEAQEIFVKRIAQIRTQSYLGFEKHQRSIDDIRPLVVNEYCSNVVNNIATLPTNYWHYIKSNAIIEKGLCKNIKAKVYIRQHDDDFELSPFDKSSFEWREINGVFTQNGIKLYTDGTFTVKEFCLSYIKKLTYIHNAEDFRNGTYTLPSGVILTGTQNSELPDHTHREIVDIAVAIMTQQLQIPDYQLKLNKIALNNIV